MIKAKRIDSEGVLLVLGFVGEAGGPIRGICVDPVTGMAKGHFIHELTFQPMFEKEEPPKPKPQEVLVDPPVEAYEKTIESGFIDQHTRPPKKWIPKKK